MCEPMPMHMWIQRNPTCSPPTIDLQCYHQKREDDMTGDRKFQPALPEAGGGWHGRLMLTSTVYRCPFVEVDSAIAHLLYCLPSKSVAAIYPKCPRYFEETKQGRLSLHTAHIANISTGSECTHRKLVFWQFIVLQAQPVAWPQPLE